MSVKTERCDACLRDLPEKLTHYVSVESGGVGAGVMICIDPVACRVYWGKEKEREAIK